MSAPEKWRPDAPAIEDKSLFGLDVQIATRAARRPDHRRLPCIQRRRFHSLIDVWWADHSVGLACSEAAMSPIGTTRTSDDVRSALAIGGIVLQNYFELPSEEIFFKIAHRCGILIQETARSDSILARFRLIHCSRASFASKADLSRCPRWRLSCCSTTTAGWTRSRLSSEEQCFVASSAAMLAERYVPGLITPELR